MERIADRAASYGIPGLRVDGNDVGEVCHVSREAVARARAGVGPTLIEALTYPIFNIFRGDSWKYGVIYAVFLT